MASKKLLVIEDEVALLYALQSKLSVEGFEVITAENGEKALQLLDDTVPHLIILDIMLPGIDGWEVLSKIRENEALVEVPVIVLSNVSDNESKGRGAKLGVKDYLVKVEFQLDEIINKIKELAG